jgi:hypothetical protein
MKSDPKSRVPGALRFRFPFPLWAFPVLFPLAGCAEATPADLGPLTQEGDRCGIAAAYPGDRGIASHPSVLFHEDFEHGSAALLGQRYTSVRNPGNLTFVQDVPPESAGTLALRMRSVGGEDTGAHLFRNLPGGHDRLHLRYYVHYDRTHRYHHTGGGLGGYNPPTPWPQGGAGTRPDGRDRFTVRVEPVGSRPELDIYTYWPEMRGNPGDASFWGNTFLGGMRPELPDDRWIAVELMVAMNDPVQASNGEMALWLDGKPVLHLRAGDPRGTWVWDTFRPGRQGEPFAGFRWRHDLALALTYLSLSHYVTGHPPGEESHVMWDDVVLATEYIGPIGGSECPAPGEG